MFKFPLIILFGITALNITAFTLLLQFDFLVIHALIAKIIAWAFTLGAWGLTYKNRNRFYTIRLNK